MEEQEKKQKTIVAFIAGLLIGGLLVWVFGVSPKDVKKEVAVGKTDVTDVSDTVKDAEVASETKTNGKGGEVVEKKPAVTETVAKGAGSISVADQDAGAVVTLGAFTMPVDNAWIVVHELNAGGTLGNALGASRYSKTEGLIPKTVELLRSTEAGKTYHVVLYSENGDRVFDLKEDALITTEGGDRIEDAFKTN